MKERATDPNFSRKLEILDRYVGQISIEPSAKKITWVDYLVGKNIPLDINVPPSELEKPKPKILHEGLSSILDHSLLKEFDKMRMYGGQGTNSTFAIDTFQELKEKLSNIYEMVKLTGPFGTRINHGEKYDPTVTARTIYAALSLYKDAFPKDFLTNGNKYLKDILKGNEDINTSIDPYLFKAVTVISPEKAKESFEKHMNEFSLSNALKTFEPEGATITPARAPKP